ncbi:P-loop NTPase [Nocardia thailandica]
MATETVTPKGVVVIDGWKPADRLESRDLIPALRQLGPGQAHLFSGEVWSGDPFIESLSKTGQLVVHQVSLDDAIGVLGESGAVTTGPAESMRGEKHIIALGDGFVDVDIHTWNQIRRSARPVDLELLTPPVFSSVAAKYQEFRTFTGATEGSPRWKGIAAGLNIRRDFEQTLAGRVAEALKERELPPPLVIHGQTATGKSVAMAALAVQLAKSGEVAVLHQSRRTVRPTLEDLDMYSSWAEDNGATATVFIWDGMVEPGEYSMLWRQLRNRGRKILMVGSAYLAQVDAAEFIEAPAELSGTETASLQALLHSFDVNFATPQKALDASFLAFLYHALPESHSSLRRGLASEMRAAEKGMEKLLRERGASASPNDRLTAMAAALQAAGFSLEALSTDESVGEKALIDQSFGERSAIQRVTTLVLVAGRHGVPVPIDLALRILGREGSQGIRDALQSFDIIREVDDDNGEYFLTARSHLEAELLAQHEISLEVEIEVVVEAIRNVRVTTSYAGAADEVQFIVSLLDRVGPNARVAKYKSHYGQISGALSDRRHETGIAHPRLVLQESNFARGYVHWRQEANYDTSDERIVSLEHNRDLLDEVLNDGTLSGMMRLSLTVELAATLGAIMHEIAQDSGSGRTVRLAGRLDDILDAVLRARAIDPGNLHPVDVLAWSTRDAIRTGMLTPTQRLDRLVDAIATIDSIDRDSLSEAQRAQLDRRATELNSLLGNDDAVWEHIQNLERNPNPAATYFLARWEAEGGAGGEAAALQRLKQAPVDTLNDWRCAQLLLDLSWRSITGKRLLAGERVPINLTVNDLRELADLTVQLSEAEMPDKYKLLFVKAITEFALGDYVDAKQTFRDIEHLTRQLSKRIRTLVLLADESGSPRIFTGRVEWANNRAGEVWVNELGAKVAFEPHLFSASRELAKHEQLPAFMVGFKLTRGPVAEPRNMFRGRTTS